VRIKKNIQADVHCGREMELYGIEWLARKTVSGTISMYLLTLLKKMDERNRETVLPY
jgi:hypothetical protein